MYCVSRFSQTTRSNSLACVWFRASVLLTACRRPGRNSVASRITRQGGAYRDNRPAPAGTLRIYSVRFVCVCASACFVQVEANIRQLQKQRKALLDRQAQLREVLHDLESRPLDEVADASESSSSSSSSSSTRRSRRSSDQNAVRNSCKSIGSFGPQVTFCVVVCCLPLFSLSGRALVAGTQTLSVRSSASAAIGLRFRSVRINAKSLIARCAGATCSS